MRPQTLGILCLLLSVDLAAQTHEAPPATQVAQDGGVRAVLESIVIPPIPNHPFSATLDTEWVQYAGEGGSVTLVNERPIVRDSKGRIYQERWALVPKFSKVTSQRVLLQIADPNQQMLYTCAIYQTSVNSKPTIRLTNSPPLKHASRFLMVQSLKITPRSRIWAPGQSQASRLLAAVKQTPSMSG